MLGLFLNNPTKHLIKIDPDTHVRKKFGVLPAFDDAIIAGCVQQAGDKEKMITSVQGGCIIMTLKAAQVLFASKLLLSPALKAPCYEWVVEKTLRARAFKHGLTSYDWTIGWACKQLKIPIIQHPETQSHWERVNLRAYLGAAVVHPRCPLSTLVLKYLTDGTRNFALNYVGWGRQSLYGFFAHE
ncbi:MAG: hypothetical protein HY537_01155 [Deltaproteobacteria bacterium]|nr:hypothetical protein [Deltaproteobacteria bacterium]